MLRYLVCCLVCWNVAKATEPLPSWNDSASKRAIIDFVQKVTSEGSSNFVPVPERIAVFDNDGTLWPENPVPFQLAYALDVIKQRSAVDSKLAAEPMVQAALKTAKHPRLERGYDQLTYQPMQEVLAYFRANSFKTFIVSGGGADFMRVWSERVYGIPPEQVIGSTARTRYETRNGLPVLVKTLEQLFVDDKEGKPVGIHQFIGRRPIACFGNSDGDKAMLEYTTINNSRPCFGLIVHHTDSEREYAYDKAPQSSGKLIDALADAPSRGWVVVDMKKDWKDIWTPTPKEPSASSEINLIGKWVAEDIYGGGVIDNALSTLEISLDGSVSGSTAVNRYAGKAKIDGQKIVIGPLAVTRRAGPPALMEQESKFTSAIGKVVSFRIEVSGLLYLSDASGNDVLRFAKLSK